MLINVQFTAESTEDLVNQMMMFVNKFEGMKIIPLNPMEANYEEAQEAQEAAEEAGDAGCDVEQGRIYTSEKDSTEARRVETLEASE